MHHLVVALAYEYVYGLYEYVQNELNIPLDIATIASLLSQATPRWPNAGVQRWYIVECEKTFKFRNQFHHSTFIPVII